MTLAAHPRAKIAAMRRPLVLHPQSPPGPITGVDFTIERDGNRLRLTYAVDGRSDELALPKAATPARADKLWQHTCFEAFARGNGSDYWEFNVSPSGKWAAYHFDSYRSGMKPANIPAPVVRTTKHGHIFELTAELDLAGLAVRLPWKIGGAAILENNNGAKSYWALAHPPGKPDFHHSVCFAIELPAA